MEKGDTGEVKEINEKGNGNKEAEGGDGGTNEKIDIIEEVDWCQEIICLKCDPGFRYDDGENIIMYFLPKN